MPQARLLLDAVLPRRQLDAHAALALVRYIQRQNYAAYCAHRRGRLRGLDTS